MLTVKVGDYSAPLAYPEIGDGIKNKPAGLVKAGEVLNTYLLQELGQGEESAGIEPFRKMISRQMVCQRFIRNFKKLALKILEISNSCYFRPRIRIGKNEIAKIEVFFKQSFQFSWQVRRSIIEKGIACLFSISRILTAGGMQ